ncbi:MAG: toxin-antitoxin system YwqK family antitoxin [Halarcobacter sp.]
MKNKLLKFFVILLLIVSIYSIYSIYLYITVLNEISDATRIDNEKTVVINYDKYYFDIQNFTLFDGEYILKYSNGNPRLKVSIKNGLRNGLRTLFYQNGNKKSEVIFKNDIANGATTRWYKNGKIMVKTAYKDGNRHGLLRIWYESGNLMLKVSFLNNKVSSKVILMNELGEIINFNSPEYIKLIKKAKNLLEPNRYKNK